MKGNWEITRIKSGRDFNGLDRSTGGRGSSLRWPLWPENPTLNETSFAAVIRSMAENGKPKSLPAIWWLTTPDLCPNFQFSAALSLFFRNCWNWQRKMNFGWASTTRTGFEVGSVSLLLSPVPWRLAYWALLSLCFLQNKLRQRHKPRFFCFFPVVTVYCCF